MALRQSSEVRGVAVSAATIKLVQQMGLKRGNRPTADAIKQAVRRHPNFPRLYTEIAALHGEYPHEVDALSRLILRINDPTFSAANLVETHFDGAIRGSQNPQGKITATEVHSQEAKMREALAEFMRFDEERIISWPSSPFEDATNIQKFAPTDEADVISHGRQLYSQFKGEVLALGVGGSSNGSKVITSAFQLEKAEHAGFTFASDYLADVLDGFDFKHGHIIVSSLSGTTSEPLTNLLEVFNRLEKVGVPKSEYKKHFTVLTGGKDSVIREMAEKYGLKVFYCKPQEGGRFSIWTVIGVLWAEANGIDSLQAKAGAMLSHYRIMDQNMKRNSAMMQAAIANAAKNKGVTLFQNLIFDERLTAYGDFLAQAWGESVEENGLGLRVRTDVCANWQHIGANGLLAVPDGVMAQMFWVRHSDSPIRLKIPKELLGIRIGSQTLGDLNGKSLDEYQADAVKGGWASFVGRGIPTSLTIIDRLSEFTLGQMTQDTFGLVGFYGGANDLGEGTYEQDWVILHKALGRGEAEKVIDMPDGKRCAVAMRHFERRFARPLAA